MNAMTLAHDNSLEASNSGPASLSWLTCIQVTCSVVGVGGGLASSIAGSLLTGAGWIATTKGAKEWLSSAGSVALFLAIPLIILGACCLDWLEKGGRSQRVSVSPGDPVANRDGSAIAID